MKKKAPKERKARAAPVCERCVEIIRKLDERARAEKWSPRRMRTELRYASDIAAPSTWAKAIRLALGSGVRALRDLRQLTMFEGGA